MADGWDWLEGISGGLSGVVKGIDAGMSPLKTWEGIRTSDLANDRYEINNRDVEFTQGAREGDDTYGYYTDKVGAEGSGYRKKMSADERDIFGNQQQLALAEYLSDPDGAFQQGLRETGWQPGSPEYRAWLAEAMAQYDPNGAWQAYDKMGVPGIQNRNLNDQAIGAVLLGWAQQKDPNATVRRNDDGTYTIMSNGEETHIAGDALLKIASMTNAKDPYAAVAAGYKDETGIQDSNSRRLAAEAAYVKSVREGTVTPSSAAAYYKELGVSSRDAWTKANQELARIDKEAKDGMWTKDERDRAMAPALAQVAAAKQSAMEAQQALKQIFVTGRIPGLKMGGGPGGGAPGGGGGPRVGPRANSEMNTQRPPPGGLGAHAAEGRPGAGPMPSWGGSAEGAPPYARRDSGSALGYDELQEYLQSRGLL